MCTHAVQSSLVAASEFHVPGCESDADAAVGVCVCVSGFTGFHGQGVFSLLHKTSTTLSQKKRPDKKGALTYCSP